jgi:hypothetical protein
MSNRNKKDRRLTTATKTPKEITKVSTEYNFMAFTQSPRPQSEELEKLEKLYPGVTKLVYDNFLAQTNHRMELEKATILGDNKRANRGQVISAVLVFLCVTIGGFLIYLNKNVEGLSMILLSLGTLLTAFYGGAILRKIERVQKGKK